MQKRTLKAPKKKTLEQKKQEQEEPYNQRALV